jgi:hypothetical protein
MERVRAAFEARDWAAMRALCTADMKFEDRRRQALVSGDVGCWIAEMQAVAPARPDARFERQLLFTAGDRLDLERILVTDEMACLWLSEVDAQGHITAVSAFDPDDWRSALTEGAARAFAADAAGAALRPVYEFFLGFNDHDPARVRASLADDVVVNEHGLVGLGLVEGGDAYVESLAAFWRLVPDLRIYAGFELARDGYGGVGAIRIVGTLPEGGAFEIPNVVVQIVARGRITRIESFEIEDVDAALARFAELKPDPLRKLR